MTAPADDVNVVDARDQSRLVVREDGAEAELDYRVDGDRITLIHTEVPAALGGRGIGATLVRAAVKRATADHLVVVPWCPFARRWLRQHPDEAAGLTIDWETPRPEG
jgi:uncharacterized protein